jgi:hypothetical protein
MPCMLVVEPPSSFSAPKISYKSGAIEDTNSSDVTPGIREEACKILEGGTEAFQLREQRYSLP